MSTNLTTISQDAMKAAGKKPKKPTKNNICDLIMKIILRGNSLGFFELAYQALSSIFRMISSVNSEHLALPPRSPVILLPSLITCRTTR